MTARERVARYVNAVLRRLPFFPVTLVTALVFAVGRRLALRQGRAATTVDGRVSASSPHVLRDILVWLTGAGPSRGHDPKTLDVCLRLAPHPGPGLPDVVSTLLAVPRVRSIALYWDETAAADDAPWWGNDGAATRDDVTGVADALDVLRTHARGLAVPSMARREALPLVKRIVGGAYTVAVNVPADARKLVDEVISACPDVVFIDLEQLEAVATTGASNVRSLFAAGLGLHERMAVVEAADAYIGLFDALGCTAILLGRAAVLLDADAPGEDLGEHTLLLPTAPPPALADAVVRFIARRRTREP